MAIEQNVEGHAALVEERSVITGIILYVAWSLISVGLIIWSFFLAEASLLRHIVTELGISGLVGLILALTIERISAAEFKNSAKSERSALETEFRELAARERNAIKSDVFHYVYGRNVPKEITDEIDHQILESKFVREGFVLRFDLETVTDPASKREYVKSTITSGYKIRNISGRPELFTLKNSIDRSPSESLAREVKFLSLQADGCQQSFHLDEGELEKRTVPEENRIRLKLSDSEPILVLPEKSTKIRIQYRAIRHRTGGRLYFSFTNHGMRLRSDRQCPEEKFRGLC